MKVTARIVDTKISYLNAYLETSGSAFVSANMSGYLERADHELTSNLRYQKVSTWIS